MRFIGMLSLQIGNPQSQNPLYGRILPEESRSLLYGFLLKLRINNYFFVSRTLKRREENQLKKLIAIIAAGRIHSLDLLRAHERICMLVKA